MRKNARKFELPEELVPAEQELHAVLPAGPLSPAVLDERIDGGMTAAPDYDHVPPAAAQMQQVPQFPVEALRFDVKGRIEGEESPFRDTVPARSR